MNSFNIWKLKRTPLDIFKKVKFRCTKDDNTSCLEYDKYWFGEKNFTLKVPRMYLILMNEKIIFGTC